MHAVQYIHNNPVRKALVDEPGKWYYSSYNCWFNGVDEPIRIDKETWPLFYGEFLSVEIPSTSLTTFIQWLPPIVVRSVAATRHFNNYVASTGNIP